MGIQNLLRFMKPFIESIHIKKYAGKRVGIDAYSWLHKGAYSCSMELCLSSGGDAASRYLQYFMHRINLLRHHKITPVVVFDGGNLPCKSVTEDERQRQRNANLTLAKEKLAQGNTSAAIEFFQRAVCITTSMAYQLIQILRSESVEFIVAPYEADAQLAYLSTLNEEQGGIAAVITEDSDLMAYGCQAIIFKMDRYGNGEEVVLDKVFNSVIGGLSFKCFDQELFAGMCVLAGCDFLPSVPGIGTKRAYSLVSKYRNLDRVLSVMKYEKGKLVPEDYSKSFMEAVAVFHHARIYDANDKMLKPMKPLPPKLLQSLDGNLDFLGPDLPPSVATAIAQGRVDPITMEAYDYLPTIQFCNDHVSTKASDYLPRAKTQVTSMQQSCFTIFSANETRQEDITVMEQKPTIDDRKYLNEAVALKKLIAPHKDCCKLEVTEAERVEFPNNNPFNKRKRNDDSQDLNVSGIEQVSDVDEPDAQCISTAESLESDSHEASDHFPRVKTQMISMQQSCFPIFSSSETRQENITGTGLQETTNEVITLKKLITSPEHCHKLEVIEVERIEFPSNNPFKKRKLNDSNLGSNESAIEQVSVVTDLDDPDVQCITPPDSQESVKSKPRRSAKLSTAKNEKRLKSMSKCKNSESEKSGILKFFTRF
ncbi:exonuclease 1 [Magnolia sinica]|uniref:exonuclease 1 n=1 Tax=Magnolia sinica TaxID=86752 RepID=UPI002657C692|nr:exonuclease 1 [Magnolia sinica]